MSKLISKIVVPDSSEATGYALYNVKDANAIPASEKGVASGVATLDSSGKVPSSQLPSYVDDVIEGFYHDNKFYEHYTPGVEGDDAALAAWGEGWRMPTKDEFQALGDAVNSAWTTNYQNSGVSGYVLTDKTDSLKVLFFPASGCCFNGGANNVGIGGNYWSSSINGASVDCGYYLSFNKNKMTWQNSVGRYFGLSVRPILTSGDSTRPYVEIGGVKWSTMNIGASSVTDAGLYFQWGDTQGYTTSQVGSNEGLKYFGWVDYKYGNGTSNPGAAGMTKYNSTDGLTTLVLGLAGGYSGEITAETGKIYVDIPTNQSYRWSGSAYIVISSPYVLPTASANTLGGVKVGDGLAIDNNGVLSAEGQEVEIGTTSPVNDVKLFVDEDGDPTYDVYTQALINAMMADKANNADLATVATSGSYADLTNTPTSQSAAQDGTALSLVTTGEKYIWNNKSSAVTTSTLPVSNGVYAIYADGGLKTAAEADSNALGVAVITDDCCFVIDKTNNSWIKWDSQYSTNGIISGCVSAEYAPSAVLNTTGVSNTDAVASVVNNNEAAKYCRTKSITINGVTKYGYLASCGEWYKALLNKSSIISVMSAIGGTTIGSTLYWSSTQHSNYDFAAWCLNWGVQDYTVVDIASYISTSSKDENRDVRPFYAITKQELNGGTITTNIPTVTIEQTTGSSTTDVMSLKAVSDKLVAMTGATALADGISGLVPTPTTSDVSKYLKGDGTWSEVALPSTMTGASSSAAGTSGLVPAPAAGDQAKFLKGDGSWGAVSAEDSRFVVQTGTSTAKAATAAGYTYYYHSIPMSQTEAKKVYSFMYYITNPYNNHNYGESIMFSYATSDTYNNVKITNSWIIKTGNTNPGNLTYRIIKAV